MKTIGLMPRRPDMSRAAFRDHYENRHAPLALGKFPFEKYVRNHVVDIALAGARKLITEHVGSMSQEQLIALAMSDIERKVH